ncbi:MAG: PAC2 family protein [Candidatus Bathyarchaeia archaeon]
MTIIRTMEVPRLRSPVLIEGLPGMGFVANVATLHMIRQLKAKKFMEVLPAQVGFTIIDGDLNVPMSQLHYSHRIGEGNDLILLYGNTQPLTVPDQYEHCNSILEIVRDLGCRSVFCLGGMRKRRSGGPSQVYCAATDTESLNKALAFGAKRVVGRIFGCTGIILGLAKLRGMSGICLLAETETPDRPDPEAAKSVMRILGAMLRLKLSITKLDSAVRFVRERTITV